MAVVYRILGEAALKLLSNKIDKAKIVDAATWEKTKRLRIPAFDSCDTKSQLFTHLRDLVLEDRDWLRPWVIVGHPLKGLPQLV